MTSALSEVQNQRVVLARLCIGQCLRGQRDDVAGNGGEQVPLIVHRFGGNRFGGPVVEDRAAGPESTAVSSHPFLAGRTFPLSAYQARYAVNVRILLSVVCADQLGIFSGPAPAHPRL